MESYAKSTSCDLHIFLHEYQVSTFTNFSSSKEARYKQTLLYRLIGSADHSLLIAIFFASMGRYEHFLVDVDVVFVNPNAVEISASAMKLRKFSQNRTYHS